MILRAGFVLLILTYVKTTDLSNEAEHSASVENYEQFINYAGLKLLKRDAAVQLAPSNDNNNNTNKIKDVKEVQKPHNIGQSEGGGASLTSAKPETNSTTAKPNISKDDKLIDTHIATNNTSNSTATSLKSNVTTSNTLKQNETATSVSTDLKSALQNPGVVKRGLIVFGGFAILAVAYFVFYRRKGKKYDANNSLTTNDTHQFRYGVLQSEDRRDNLELSRIPLTMESDEDDEEDLDIFDLEQKRKSLSYVNLQTNDEDVVLHSSNDASKNNLLLDIEDGPSDTLINWSNSGSNSIL